MIPGCLRAAGVVPGPAVQPPGRRCKMDGPATGVLPFQRVADDSAELKLADFNSENPSYDASNGVQTSNDQESTVGV